MEESIEGIDPSSTLSLADVVSEHSKHLEIQQQTADALTNAVETAVEFARHNGSEPLENANLSGAPTGSYRDELGDVASSVERDGVEPKHEEETDGVIEVAESLKDLVHELTNWQVTWGVAQSAQKDLSHVLKSS